ncbi:hypothetical protein [Motilibacter aurantiacus]|uniref:hypothetical protein n=1 Tax=Motilibacter aurantiacus TaxID=2714955 RepID=UPI00140B5224|nr:hypothetical protein [Motilibacter aurantiacus]NHC47601.1 hypothetical protein [Motilibacter aurantiacus]
MTRPDARPDDLARLRAARPTPSTGWAGSPAGRRTLDRVLAEAGPAQGPTEGRATGAPPRRPRPSRSRWLPLAGVVVASVAAAGAVTIRDRSPAQPGLTVLCYAEARAQAEGAVPRQEFTGLPPLDACRRSYPVDFPDRPVPESFALCVADGGGLIVVPSRTGLSDDVPCVQAGARPASGSR